MLFVHGDIRKALLIALVCQVCLYYASLYDLRVVSDRRELFIGVVQALSATSFLLAAIYFWFPGLVIGRGVFLVSSALVLVAVAGWRLVFEWLTRRVAPRERLLLVGTSPAAVSLAKELFERRQELGVEIVGFVDPDPARVGAPVINPGVIGTIDDIPVDRPGPVGRPRRRQPGRRARQAADGQAARDEARRRDASITSRRSTRNYTGKIAVENLRPSWLIFSAGFRKSRLAASREAG